jgi:hypothetical protein
VEESLKAALALWGQRQKIRLLRAGPGLFESRLLSFLEQRRLCAGSAGNGEPATIRTQVLTCGAILGRSGRRLVAHLSQDWGGPRTRIPLLESLLRRQIPTSPKLDPMLVT